MQQIKLILFTLIILTLAGCGKKAEHPGTGEPKVAVTILPYADFVSQIADDRLKVEVLVLPGVSPETYDPRPGELSELETVKAYFRVSPMFAFENTILDKLSEGNPELEIIDCSRGVATEDNNPHIWLDPVRVKIITENIYDNLSRLFPERKSEFSARKEKFVASLDSLDNSLRTEFSGYRGRKILTFHPAWGYFTSRYGIEEVSIEKEGKSPSAGEMAELIDFIKKNNIKTIFLEPQFDRDVVNSLADQLDLKVVQIDPLPADFIGNTGRVAKQFVESFK